jgi:coproporphyrinogen III oxidase
MDTLSASARRADASRWIAGLHDELTSLFGRLDRGGTFSEDRGSAGRRRWCGARHDRRRDVREGRRSIAPRSWASCRTPPRATGRPRAPRVARTGFFATGVSLVVHPRSPMVPTVHLNVRYFELTDGAGTLTDSWFGGGRT